MMHFHSFRINNLLTTLKRSVAIELFSIGYALDVRSID